MSTAFDQRLAAAALGDGGVVTHFVDGAEALIFIFSGMPVTPDGQWSPFQFVRSTSDLPADKVYLRDLKRAWYQLGIEPLTRAVDDTAALLCEYVVTRGARRVITFGSSSGGFAAILFGHLLGADEVHAIAPRTYVDIDNRLKYDDFFMDEYVEALYAAPDIQREYFDLRAVLSEGSSARCFVHFARDRRIDVANARHLEGVANVFLLEYDRGGHQLARTLRDSGRLHAILEDAIGGRTAPPASPVTHIQDSARA